MAHPRPRPTADRELIRDVVATGIPTETHSPLRILVVEDELSVRRALDRLLQILGHHVATASRGAEALTVLAASTEPFDLLLTDYLMPAMLGDELIFEALRLPMPPGRIVMITAGAVPRETVEKLRAFGIEIVAKPIGLEQLKDMVRSTQHDIDLSSMP